MSEEMLSAAINYYNDHPKESQNSIALKFGVDRFKLAYKIKTQGQDISIFKMSKDKERILLTSIRNCLLVMFITIR